MSKKKLLALLTASALTVGLLSGCGGGGGTTESPSGGGETTPVNTETEPGAASGGDIYVLVPNADHGWTGAVLNYAQEKAEEVNAEGSYNVVVQAATDAKNQQEQIDDLLAAATPPAGIVILPYDNTMESSMASIAATDIPFIMVDRIIDNPVVQEKVTANVKGDNEGIGKATAERFSADGLQPGDKLHDRRYLLCARDAQQGLHRDAGCQRLERGAVGLHRIFCRHRLEPFHRQAALHRLDQLQDRGGAGRIPLHLYPR